MKEQHRYDQVYGLFARLSDRSRELTDQQHLGVMEAFNCLTEQDTSPSPTLSVGVSDGSEDTVEELLDAAVQALASLVEATADGFTGLRYARSQSLLVASFPA